MSIHWGWMIAKMGSISPIVMSAVAPAPSITAEQALEAAAELYALPQRPPQKRIDCDDPVGNEIVVCAPLENAAQMRVRSSLDEGDESHLQWAGDPPDVTGPGIFKGPATASGCIKGVTCPPPPAYIFDIEALPEPPPGSDADKIARGEKPGR